MAGKKGQKIIFTEGCDTATYFYADCIHSHSNLVLQPFFLLRRLSCHFLKLLNRITSGILWSCFWWVRGELSSAILYIIKYKENFQCAPNLNKF